MLNCLDGKNGKQPFNIENGEQEECYQDRLTSFDSPNAPETIPSSIQNFQVLYCEPLCLQVFSALHALQQVRMSSAE